jgi:hypothetical protein
MPICPRCHDTYVDGVVACVDCGLELLPDDAPLPARVDRLLGTFDPLVAERLGGLLVHRGIPHRLVDHDGRTEVIVDRDWADELRAELATSWGDVLGGLSSDERVDLAPTRLRGWYDAPEGAWIDRHGRIQVDPAEDAGSETARIWGPSLALVGGVLGLFGWYAGRSLGLAVLGLAALVVGLLLPR